MKDDKLIHYKQQKAFINKRKSERIVIKFHLEIEPIELKDECEMKIGESYGAISINMSSGGLLSNEIDGDKGSGGLLIENAYCIPINSILKLTFTLPLPGLTTNCILEGKVLRCEASESHYGKFNVAIQFIKILYHKFNNVKLDQVKRMLGL